jgi:hypothetical protein
VTRGVLRGLVRLQLLPAAARPTIVNFTFRGVALPRPRARSPTLADRFEHGLLEGAGDRRRGRATRTPRPRRGSTTGARGDPEGRTDWSACKSTRERRRTHRVSRRPTCTSPRVRSG